MFDDVVNSGTYQYTGGKSSDKLCGTSVGDLIYYVWTGVTRTEHWTLLECVSMGIYT